FAGQGYLEYVVWAVGCMTTSVPLPGREAVLGIKFLHCGILATGIFQITYLLGCFSIMVSTEGERAAQKAADLLKLAEQKHSQLVLDVETVGAAKKEEVQTTPKVPQ